MWASCATAPRCRVPLKCLPPMPDLYPFLLLPILDERPWGVRDLRPIYTKIVKEPIGESWLTWEDNRVGRAGSEAAQARHAYRDHRIAGDLHHSVRAVCARPDRDGQL